MGTSRLKCGHERAQVWDNLSSEIGRVGGANRVVGGLVVMGSRAGGR